MTLHPLDAGLRVELPTTHKDSHSILIHRCLIMTDNIHCCLFCHSSVGAELPVLTWHCQNRADDSPKTCLGGGAGENRSGYQDFLVFLFFS